MSFTAEFLKCPKSIPNGFLEPHCGPATDWLCHFQCNSYRRHSYMTGILKNFFDDPYDIYCDNGSWKTGFEDIGLDIWSVCVAEGNLTKVFIFLPINLNMCFWYSKEKCFQLLTLIFRPAVNKQDVFPSTKKQKKKKKKNTSIFQSVQLYNSINHSGFDSVI